MKKTVTVVLLLAALAFIVACSGNETQEEDGMRTDLNLHVQEAIQNFDPHIHIRGVDIQVHKQIYEAMFWVRDDRSLMPLLAERYEIADDGVTYTFHLRRGVLFHNGEEMTADDVIFSLERALEAPSLFTWTEPIYSFRQIDDYTVEIVSRHLFPMFAEYMASVAIMNRAHTTAVGDDIMENPVGTGPYTLYEFVPDLSVTLRAFENYWGGSPSIETINWRTITDPSTALIAFEAGELDLIRVPSANWDAIVAQDRWDTILKDSVHITFVVFNTEREPFTDRRVRQAFNYAINRQDMVIMAMDGLAIPAYTMHNPLYVFGAPDDFYRYEFNPDRARELLAEAGFPDGLELPPIVTLAGTFYERVAVILQANFADIGVDMPIGLYEAGSFGPAVATGESTIAIMGFDSPLDFDAWRVGYTAQFMNNLNLARYYNPLVEELFDRGIQTIDPDERRVVYRELDQILQYDMPYAPIFYTQRPFAIDRNLNYYYYLSWVRFVEVSWKE